MVYLKPKQLIIKDCARRFVSKLYRHEASRYHFATAELLVMAEAAILNFGKTSITLDWIKISCIKLYGKMHHGDAEMTP